MRLRRKGKQAVPPPSAQPAIPAAAASSSETRSVPATANTVTSATAASAAAASAALAAGDSGAKAAAGGAAPAAAAASETRSPANAGFGHPRASQVITDWLETSQLTKVLTDAVAGMYKLPQLPANPYDYLCGTLPYLVPLSATEPPPQQMLHPVRPVKWLPPDNHAEAEPACPATTTHGLQPLEIKQHAVKSQGLMAAASSKSASKSTRKLANAWSSGEPPLLLHGASDASYTEDGVIMLWGCETVLRLVHPFAAAEVLQNLLPFAHGIRPPNPRTPVSGVTAVVGASILHGTIDPGMDAVDMTCVIHADFPDNQDEAVAAFARCVWKDVTHRLVKHGVVMSVALTAEAMGDDSNAPPPEWTIDQLLADESAFKEQVEDGARHAAGQAVVATKLAIVLAPSSSRCRLPQQPLLTTLTKTYSLHRPRAGIPAAEHAEQQIALYRMLTEGVFLVQQHAQYAARLYTRNREDVGGGSGDRKSKKRQAAAAGVWEPEVVAEVAEEAVAQVVQAFRVSKDPLSVVHLIALHVSRAALPMELLQLVHRLTYSDGAFLYWIAEIVDTLSDLAALLPAASAQDATWIRGHSTATMQLIAAGLAQVLVPARGIEAGLAARLILPALQQARDWSDAAAAARRLDALNVALEAMGLQLTDQLISESPALREMVDAWAAQAPADATDTAAARQIDRRAQGYIDVVSERVKNEQRQRVPRAMADTAVRLQYAVDMRLDRVLRDAYQALVQPGQLVSHPFIGVVTRLRLASARAKWFHVSDTLVLQKHANSDVRLVDPAARIHQLGSMPMFGAPCALRFLDGPAMKAVMLALDGTSSPVAQTFAGTKMDSVVGFACSRITLGRMFGASSLHAASASPPLEQLAAVSFPVLGSVYLHEDYFAVSKSLDTALDVYSALLWQHFNSLARRNMLDVVIQIGSRRQELATLRGDKHVFSSTVVPAVQARQPVWISAILPLPKAKSYIRIRKRFVLHYRDRDTGAVTVFSPKGHDYRADILSSVYRSPEDAADALAAWFPRRAYDDVAEAMELRDAVYADARAAMRRPAHQLDLVKCIAWSYLLGAPHDPLTDATTPAAQHVAACVRALSSDAGHVADVTTGMELLAAASRDPSVNTTWILGIAHQIRLRLHDVLTDEDLRGCLESVQEQLNGLAVSVLPDQQQLTELDEPEEQQAAVNMLQAATLVMRAMVELLENHVIGLIAANSSAILDWIADLEQAHPH